MKFIDNVAFSLLPCYFPFLILLVVKSSRTFLIYNYNIIWQLLFWKIFSDIFFSCLACVLVQEDFNLGRKLGEGAFGTVYKASFSSKQNGKVRVGLLLGQNNDKTILVSFISFASMLTGWWLGSKESQWIWCCWNMDEWKSAKSLPKSMCWLHLWFFRGHDLIFLFSRFVLKITLYIQYLNFR